ncbi:MEKHLA domain-containing protein [Asticcacaulis sp. EMRT-3]|uniref:MEKHLA domain-containing protein n=1 Tax=Asticcacaulis sp. EMRT-3 TaxID=3040349 RepID=UPI0024AEEA60|nr:MEKHLA domain-containing protein [Asticcacaulis sp. EMRT-3]MDI7774451.1 MEKHLA domain-containing protein [Asticcacaulis sp. EMRT-3]
MTLAQQRYARLLAKSFARLTGQLLVAGAEDLSDSALAESLFAAPQAIVSHGTQTDPVFRYANAQALSLWEMDWEAFTRLPSRLSAEARGDVQADRDALLREALGKGWVDSYSGVRISSTGRRFMIDQTVLWNVTDEDGVRHGQAAFIRNWRYL